MRYPAAIAAHLPADAGIVDQLGCSGATVLMFPDRVLKVQEDCNVSANETNMLTWLQGRAPVPQVIATAHEEGRRWLLMSRTEGVCLCDPAILDQPERLAELCAEGLRKLWAVDITGCPTDRRLAQKFREIEAGLRAGTITREQAAQPETYGDGGFSGPAELFDWLVKHQPEEEPVLSHGDFCLPNLLLDGQGQVNFIDVGLSGVADKWLDIEKCLWSMWANMTGVFGGKKRPFDRQLLFDALGMEPDDEVLRYYSLLDEIG